MMKAWLPSICLILLSSCQREQVKIQPSVEKISESVYASGVVKSKNQYEVFSTVNGIIKEILVHEGDSVKPGTPLFKIFNKTSLLNTHNAQLAAEHAKLIANQAKLDEMKMAVEVADKKKQNDSLLWHRQQNLWKQNIGTKAELEQRELNYKNSLNNYKAAVVGYRELQWQMQLNINQSQNTLQINRTISDEYTIKSEIKGMVYKVLKNEGEMANTMNPIALIGDDGIFLLELQVDENDIVQIKPGQRVIISMDSYRGKTYEARVTHIDPSMNERSKSFTVKATFVDPPEVLYPFLTVEANIVIRTKDKALTIPRAYLVNDTAVITEGKIKKRIVTGLKDYQKVEIISGLEPGEFILQPEE